MSTAEGVSHSALTLAIRVGCVALTVTSCVLIGVAPYPAAAVMAGTGVAAAGVNRSVTGDCWGSCQGHTMCERDSGLCVPIPCGGECRYDEACVDGRCAPRRREQPGSPIDADGAAPHADDETRVPL
jgi:hypothetical protein